MNDNDTPVAGEATTAAKGAVAPHLADFLVAHGGPFYELQLRLRLLREQALTAGPRAALFVILAWGVPLALSILGGRAWGPFDQRPFLLDLGAWSRFLIAVGIFILMERQVEAGLRTKFGQFTRVPLIAPDDMSAAAEAVNRALRRRDSRLAELACLLGAIVATVASLFRVLGSSENSWLVSVSEGSTSLTAAAWWCIFISSPIFWFLLFRALWRHLVWSLLLRDFAHRKLRLVAAHPDGKGGLSFIGEYPNVYTLFVFALSCVVASVLATELIAGSLSTAVYGSVMGVWLVIVLALFAFPLMAFTFPLARLKQQTLLTSGAQATRFHRASERKVLQANIAAPDAEEAAAPEEVIDASGIYDKARKLSVFLLSRSAIVPVCAAALLPLVAAGATKMPYKELLQIAKKLLLL